jgi:YHS domain-containing protein
LRKFFLFTMAVSLTGFLALAATAAETAPSAPDTVSILKPQTNCLVTGDPIDSSSHIDLQGQRIYMCCDMCASKIKADPDKYFEKAAKQGILFENVQTKCPVSGEEIDKTVFSDYSGRRIYFCCKKCVATFKKDPGAVLAKMDQPAPKEAGKTDMPGMNHEGH